jgi:serpin B
VPPPPVVSPDIAFALWSRLGEAGPLTAREGWRELALDIDDRIFAPCSISSALGMTSAGAGGKTLAEMEKTLHLPAQDKLHPAFAALGKEMNVDSKAKRGFELWTANRLWGQKGLEFKPEFLKVTSNHYGASLESVDCRGDNDAARRKINVWVAKETHDQIKELIWPVGELVNQRGVLNSDTGLVLTNISVFKGQWDSPFKKDQTQGKYMEQTGSFPYAETDEAQVLALPFAGTNLRMVLLLPKKRDNLTVVEKGLTADKFTAALAKLTSQKIRVLLPKFEFAVRFGADTSDDLGLEQACWRGADLKGIAGSSDHLISGLVQRAVVEVNEEGTAAIAASAVTIGPSPYTHVSGAVWGRVGKVDDFLKKEKPLGAKGPNLFCADHPFLFAITDAEGSRILFLGRVGKASRRLVDPVDEIREGR